MCVVCDFQREAAKAKIERAEQTVSAEQAEQAEQAEPAEQAGQTELAEQTEQAERADQAEQAGLRCVVYLCFAGPVLLR